MQPLVLGRAVEAALRGEALAARQVHAALRAAHHVFPAGRRRRPRRAALDAAAIRPEYPVDQQQAEHDQDDLRQSTTPESGGRTTVRDQRQARRSPWNAYFDSVRGQRRGRGGHARRKRMVGVRGFEPPTPASRTQCATRLSYTPMCQPSAASCSRQFPQHEKTRGKAALWSWLRADR